MKHCPNPTCSYKQFIPDDANFCPSCGMQLRSGRVVFIPYSTCRTVQKPFLFDGKGRASTIEGRIVVDIRQCVRTKGVGWTGEYHFTGNSPVEYDGFYAVFDESAYIQILVIEGKLSTIFLMAGDYTLKISHESNDVTYCGYYDKNNQLLKNNSTEWNDAKFYISPVLDQLFETYSHECKEFFGISLQQLFKDMKDY